ncbi:ABC transporter substrate-binding protein [Limnochorda pilosa]|uniref:ABC transporter substrate-binding protein n=1 Tax=Limnochorda pilosa TaxID=1555112 RepID=UPI000835A8CB|nr:ABC transporter substrate-binding protein [Limnochorda pilosa]
MRTLRTLLLAAAVVAMLAPAARAAERVTWWYENATPEQERILRADFVDRFNASQSQYVLDLRFDPNLDSSLRTALLAGSGPDIVFTHGVAYALPYIKNGQLMPLDDYAKRYGWYDRFLPVMISLGSHQGHLYALPKSYESMVLFYNKTLFQKNGWKVPSNREELEALARTMQAKGIVPFAQGNAGFRFANEHYVGVFLNHYAGAENIHKALTGKVPWNAPVFVDAIALLNDYYQKGWLGKDYFSLTYEDYMTLLSTGRAAMTMNGTWAFQWMPAFFGQTGQEWDWAPLPALSDQASYPLFDLGIGATLSINAAAKNADGAAAVLDRLSGDKQVITDLNRDWPGEWNLPVTTLDASDFGDKVDPRYARHADEVAEAVARGNYGYTVWTFWPPKTESYIVEGIEQVWLGEVTPQQFMDRVNELFQQELAEGSVPPTPAR